MKTRIRLRARFNPISKHICEYLHHHSLIVHNEVLKPRNFNIRKATGKERVVRHASSTKKMNIVYIFT